MKSFRSYNSNRINVHIPTILTTLFQINGQIPEEELLQEEANLCAKVFNITEPLIILFNKVEDLQELAGAATIPYLDAQIIN